MQIRHSEHTSSRLEIASWHPKVLSPFVSSQYTRIDARKGSTSLNQILINLRTIQDNAGNEVKLYGHVIVREGEYVDNIMMVMDVCARACVCECAYGCKYLCVHLWEILNGTVIYNTINYANENVTRNMLEPDTKLMLFTRPLPSAFQLFDKSLVRAHSRLLE